MPTAVLKVEEWLPGVAGLRWTRVTRVALSTLLAASAACLDLYGLLGLAVEYGGDFRNFAELHAGAWLLGMTAVPMRGKPPGRGDALAAASAAALLPVCGILAWLVLATSFRRQAAAQEAPRWRRLASSGCIPVSPPAISRLRTFSAEDVTGILRFCADPARRLAAVTALARFPDGMAIPALRQALNDPEDDVRLLTFNILDCRQKRMDARVAEGEALKNCGDQAKSDRLLAINYWEQAYSGLAQADLEVFLLETADRHGERALAANPADAGLHLLLGRIRTRLKDSARGRRALLAARSLGIAPDRIDPYLRELAAMKCGHGAVPSAGLSGRGDRGSAVSRWLRA